ncbi:MAG: helix-turn-helix domain-containing protein [Congregibacter sp.]
MSVSRGSSFAQWAVTTQYLSLLRTGRLKGVRFSTLEKICKILDCQPGDILR